MTVPLSSGGPGADLLYGESEQLGARYAATTNELARLRDWLWLDQSMANDSSQTTARDLGDYVFHLSRESLAEDGYRFIPDIAIDNTRRELAGHNRQRYARETVAWLGRSLPLDFLEGIRSEHVQIDHLTQSMEKNLRENGFGETHLHLGASMSFAHLWTYVQNSIALPNFRFDQFQTPHGAFQNGKKFALWLLCGSIARFMLAKFLSHRKRHQSFEDLEGLGGFERFECYEFQRLRRQGIDGQVWFQVRDALLNPKTCFLHFDQSTFCRLQLFYRQLACLRGHPPTCLAELEQSDPTYKLFSGQQGLSCEKRILTETRNYFSILRNGKIQDAVFSKVFWQTQRLRCLFYSHIVQQQEVGGLVWFTRYYRRISPSRKGVVLDRTQLIAGAVNSGFGNGLTSLEIRTGPPKTIQDVIDDVNEIRCGAQMLAEASESPLPLDKLSEIRNGVHPTRQESYATVDPNRIISSEVIQLVEAKCEVGLVYHFVKERERGSQERLSPFGEGGHSYATNRTHSPFSFGDYFVKTRQKANAVAYVLRHYPLSLFWIRGIDICNDELAMPTWLFAPLFQPIVEASRFASGYLARTIGVKIAPVRPNAHVGEDFVHLLTGLRLIDEVLEILEIREGDRIGHALALGTDPEKWCDSSGPVAIDKLTRLLDLVWEWSLAEHLPASYSASRNHRIEMEMQFLIDDLFGHWDDDNDKQNFGKPTINEVERLTQNLRKWEKLREIGFPSSRRNISHLSREQYVLYQFLTDPIIQRRSKAIKLVDPTGKGASLLAIQDSLRTKVAFRSVTVEVNPTSNLVVGGFTDLSSHPLWRLNSPNYTSAIPPVSLCIGSDDPLVFATDLRQEYQRLADALSQSGFAATDIDRWIDQVRRKSLEVRSTVKTTCFTPIQTVFVK